MKKRIALFVIALSALPLTALAGQGRTELKVATEVKTAEAPNCAEGMEPGTLCRYVPLNSVTFNVPNVVSDLPALPLKIILPAGMRSINAQVHLEVSPTTVCDPAASDVYDGIGGLRIDCQEEP